MQSFDQYEPFALAFDRSDSRKRSPLASRVMLSYEWEYVAAEEAEKNRKTNAANGVNFWEFKGFIQNENEKNIDHQIKIGLDQNFQNVVG